MMNRLVSLAVAIMALLVTACDDNTAGIGQTLTNETDQLDIASATLTVQSHTVPLGAVLSLTKTCYLGRVVDPLTQTLVETSFTTQFHPLEEMRLYAEDSVSTRWNGMAAADTCDLVLYLNSPFIAADSLSAYKLRIREMQTPVEEGQHYYTNYDPESLGMLRQDSGALDIDKVFSYRDLTVNYAQLDSSGYQNVIHVSLTKPYTDRQGVTYNNYGTYLMQQYYKNPSKMRNVWYFTHNICPGLYIEVEDGLGFHSQVTDMGIRLTYKVGTDSVFYISHVLAGTHEVLQTTKVTNDEDLLDVLSTDQSCTYLKTPAGLATELVLPVEEIKSGHDRDSLIAARISIGRLNNESMQERQFGTPQTLLMVQSDSLQNFFERTKMPDNRTSFLSSFSSSTNVYPFTNISNMITWMWNQRVKGLKSDPHWVENHPNWNRVTLVPVNAIYSSSSSSSTLSGVEHLMQLTATRLLNTKPDGQPGIEMNVVYAKFNE